MLELAVFGIAGFVVGFAIFTLLWTMPLTAPLYLQDVVRNPLFWALGILSGLVAATGFYVAGRIF